MYKLFSIIILLLGTLFGSIVYLTCHTVPDQCIYLPVIIISFILLLRDFFEYYKKKLAIILVASSIIRFFIMLWNVYGRDIYCLPGIGSDTEGFFRSASAISMDFSLLGARVYGAYYVKYLGIIYHSIGPSYLFGSYLNFLYSIYSIIILHDVLCEFSFLNERDRERVVLVFAFMPNFMIIGSSLRRESLIILFTMLSQKEIIQWVRTSELIDGFRALLFVLMGSVFHAGVIGLVTGYILMLLFYDPRANCWRLRRNSIITAVIIVAVMTIVFGRYRTVFLAKLLTINEEAFFRAVNRSVGGAAYLTNLKIDSVEDIIKYLPLKLFYFICAPVPWDWRNFSDVIAFSLDSLIYIIAVRSMIWSINKAKKMPVLFSLNISALSSMIIFAVGSQNSANAMRHRLKILGPILIVGYVSKVYRTVLAKTEN